MNKLVSFIRRKILRISSDRWNHQYTVGKWEGLHKEEERFSEVIHLSLEGIPAPAILEIGCGEAVMLRKMDSESYSFFTGVDLSEVAIEKAKAYERDNVKFLVADMETFTPDKRYDLIVFNESLYYSKRPEVVVKRMLPFLNKEGKIVVSSIENKYSAHLWPALEGFVPLLKSSEVKVGDLKWVIKVFQPDLPLA